MTWLDLKWFQWWFSGSVLINSSVFQREQSFPQRLVSSLWTNLFGDELVHFSEILSFWLGLWVVAQIMFFFFYLYTKQQVSTQWLHVIRENIFDTLCSYQSNLHFYTFILWEWTFDWRMNKNKWHTQWNCAIEQNKTVHLIVNIHSCIGVFCSNTHLFFWQFSSCPIGSSQRNSIKA